MCALRLECFTNETPLTGQAVPLFEAFDSEFDIAFSKGIKSGAAAATKAFEDQKIRSLAPILEAINDFDFSQAEARQAALRSLRPLIDAILETALPACAKAGFRHEITARVMEIAEKSPNIKMTISVPPDTVKAVAEMLSPVNKKFEILGDASLGPLEARVNWRGGFEQLDISGVIENARLATQEFFEVSTQTTGVKHA